MTDKQIIIDGVPVQDCLFLATNKMGDDIGTYCRDFNGSCKNIQNCYFKRWQRKEQECEELKEKVKKYGEINEQETKDYAELKAENDELKTMLKDLSYESQKFCYQIEEQTKQLEPFKDEYFKGLDNVVIAELAKKSIRITAENCKLEQTLTEIKEIAEAHKKDESVWNPYRQLDKILQKISEVEDETN